MHMINETHTNMFADKIAMKCVGGMKWKKGKRKTDI